MVEVYILIGLPGSGKTTLAKQIQAKDKTTVVLSSDEIRKDLINKKIIGKEYSSDDNPLVFNELYKQAERACSNGFSVVIDSTNIPTSARKPIFNRLSPFKPKFIAYVLLLDNQTCVNRIIKRQNEDATSHTFKNPYEAVEIYRQRLLEGRPSLEEGFHEIFVYNNEKLVSNIKKVLIASTNSGKIAIYAAILDKLKLSYCSLKELDVNLNVEETGKTTADNAIIKAKAYNKITGLPVIANDSGLFIKKLKKHDQPGVLVRRNAANTEQTDLDLIHFYAQKIKEVGGSSNAYFLVSLAIINNNNKLKVKNFKSHRYFVDTPSKQIVPGLPLRTLDFDKKTNKYLSEMTVLEANQFEGKSIVKQSKFIKKQITPQTLKLM